MEIKRASERAGIEIVEKFKCLGVTLSATDAIMVSEAKRAYDNCTMAEAKKLAKIYCESHEMRARLY